jgi:predicted translin family RNA/ssDNA-binding protein
VVTGDTLVELVFREEVEELGEDGATFVHKVKNRLLAVEHPQEIVAELKSKNDRTARICRFYRTEIVVRKILTGQ